MGLLFSLTEVLVGCSKEGASHSQLGQRTFVVALPPQKLGYSGRELLKTLRLADEAWRKSCRDRDLPKLSFELGAERDVIRRDGKNVIRVSDGRFCPDGARDPTDCYEAHRAAITHVYPLLDGKPLEFFARPPEIDIEINAANFRWKQLGEEALGRVLRHELGHVFGLEHSCRPPACDDAARQSIMYPHPLERDDEPPKMPTARDCEALKEVR